MLACGVNDDTFTLPSVGLTLKVGKKVFNSLVAAQDEG
jgi:hypothetical protein